MRNLWVVTFVIGAACGKAADKAPEAQGPGSAATTSTPKATTPTPAAADAATAADAVAQAAATPTLAVTLAGKPVTFVSAIATQDGDQVRIYLASYPSTCEEKISGSSSRSSTPEDVDSELRIGPYLTPGGLGWGLRGSYMHRTEPGPDGKTTSISTQTEKEDGAFPMAAGLDLVAVAAAGATTEVPLDYATGAENLFTVKGSIKVTGCGPLKRAADPAPVQLGDATMTIAGKTLSIGGAGFIVKKDGTRQLQLGTHPVKCVDGSDYTSTRSDVSLKLTFSKAGVLTHAERSGAWVDWGVNQAEPIKLSVTPNRAPGGAKKLAIKLGGDTTIDKLPFALAGKLEAIVCPTAK